MHAEFFKLRRKVVSLSLALSLALPGCLVPPDPVAPMPLIWNEVVPGRQQEALLVFLPGRRDQPEDFLRNGFLQEMRDSNFPADAVFTDAHLGYYYRRSLPERLVEDVLKPAREKGYREIWVVGISLGGLGAVLFDKDVPGWWDGMVLIAPFTGDNQDVLDRVRSVPSIDMAELPELYPTEDYTAKFWDWMKGYQARPHVPLFVALGKSDRMYGEQALMIRELPPQQVVEVEGGHTWPVWKELWGLLIPRIEGRLNPPESN